MSAERFGAALANQMARSVKISQQIRAFYKKIEEDDHHRYRSWEHCYSFFQRKGRQGIIAQRDDAAVQLGFYLASWGMYRGSSYLLQQAYTVHLAVIDCLGQERFDPLWKSEFGSADEDTTLVNLILVAAEAVKVAYKKFQATDTLKTKVLLGTLGCLPACDLYFRRGLRNDGLEYSKLNKPFVNRILQFCRKNLDVLQTEQKRIEAVKGIHYPLMKLVDMYFWQTGSPSTIS
jgi:hypothetical protein